jgi:tetratricopeptide (TPR) repeat protein
VWQALREELHPRGLEIVTVALDIDPEHARPFIEAARPQHPSLIDRAHVVDELFGIVNVGNSVWIDENGLVVRPAEAANLRYSFEERVRRGEIPPMLPFSEKRLDLHKRLRYDQETYKAALRDWVEKGADSEWARTPEEVVERSGSRSGEQARAAAHFELGQVLFERGDVGAAQEHWREAHRLYPENWTYKRQAWELASPMIQGPAEGVDWVYEGNWEDDVTKFGPENYYPPMRK